jgi:putative ABC transport system permease protein
MDRLLQDIRYALRTLRKSPGFTTVALLTLALGIGATTAIFTVVNTVLLRPLPFPDAERLVVVWERSPHGEERNVVSPANFAGWREQSQAFEELATHFSTTGVLTGAGEPEELRRGYTTTNFFATLGVAAQVGRTFQEDDDHSMVLLSHRLWQSRFGGDPGVIGQTITLSDHPRTVVGVMPADFRFLDPQPALWTPMQIAPEARGRFLTVVGRLRPGTTIEQARSEMSTIAGRLEAEHPQFNTGFGTTVLPLHEQIAGDVRPALLVMLGAVAFLLLIACSNVANLLLGRAAARSKELAVRLSLGATRGRLIRQTLTESLVLAASAGTLGLLVAHWGTQLLVRSLPAELALPRLQEVGVDGYVLGFAVLVSLLTGVLFGMLPALVAGREDLSQTLRDATRGTTRGVGRSRVRSALVVVEVALALVLLVGAGLLARSFWQLQQVDPGVQPEQVLTMRLTLAASVYDEEAARRTLAAELIPRLESLPGARSAGAVGPFLPLSGEKSSTMYLVEGRPPPSEGEEPGADIRVVAGEYFRTLGIPLLRGRLFDDRDHENSPTVFVINEALAREQFPGQDPVGQRLSYWWGDMLGGEVIGVVGSVREMGPTEDPSPAIYRAHRQDPVGQLHLVIRTAGDPLALAGVASAAVRGIDPNLAVGEVRTMETVLGRTIARPRMNVLLLGIFSGMALLLAAIGIYGIISYSVTQRLHELGVRVALGAQPRDVLRLVVGQGLALTVAGLGVGLLTAVAVTRVMASLLFGVSATDPGTLAAVSLFLVAVATLASYLPARRATRIDPIDALRAE